eukprot:gene9422-33178_t
MLLSAPPGAPTERGGDLGGSHYGGCSAGALAAATAAAGGGLHPSVTLRDGPRGRGLFVTSA